LYRPDCSLAWRPRSPESGESAARERVDQEIGRPEMTHGALLAHERASDLCIVEVPVPSSLDAGI